MVTTNEVILNLIRENWVLLALIVALTVPVVPPNWAGYWKYNNNKQTDGHAKKMTILQFVIDGLIHSVVSPIFLQVLVLFGYKETITIIIFSVVCSSIFFEHRISKETITFAAIGIVALYLEKLITTGKSLRLFGGALEWHKKED